MEYLVTSAEMQACDRIAIEKLHIPGIVLMENAGRGVADAIVNHFGQIAGKIVLIVCGKGNNGGDGFVIARHLLSQDAIVNVALVGNPSGLKGDAKTNYDALTMIGKHFRKSARLNVITGATVRKLGVLPTADGIVDALFGTGFSGNVRPPYADILRWMNGQLGWKVAVDIPSGISADNGEKGNIAFEAQCTVTMGLKKIGLIAGNGRACAGSVQVVDVGIPAPVFDSMKIKTYLLNVKDIRQVLPRRPFNAHKHSVGKVFVIAGSRGLTGAAAMASSSAMKAGAGAVVLGAPASVYSILARKLTEVMVEAYPETDQGTLGMASYEAMLPRLRWANILIVGPGLGRHPETRDLIWKIVREVNIPMLIDADGLNALSENPSLLQRHKSKEIIITPHTGELGRLTGNSARDIESNRVSVARDFAKKFKLTLVLKGAPTVTANERGEVYVNSTGNPGMATAGAGDILSGIIAGLWGQGIDRTPAAYAGAYLHGLAGDLGAQKYGEKSLLATDLQHLLPNALLEVEKSDCG